MNIKIEPKFLFPTQYWEVEFKENIKELQTNLYTYLKAFLEDEIIIDVPYEKSERIRLKN